MSWLQDMARKVQSSIPEVPKISTTEMLEKLTLTTPELAAERRRIDAQEKRKERVREMLAGMLPWETRDPERDILVEECKEAILKLSHHKSTFYGPYQMPPPGARTTNDDDESVPEEEKPSKESLEMLAKLEPLPSLLRDFDFQAHVGLIEKILGEDKQLVKMQSTLSGGGPRERVFWRNYFFHCAYSRYEAGLSIDEIWSELTDEERAAMESSQHAAEEEEEEHQNGEETITFDSAQEEGEETESASIPQKEASPVALVTKKPAPNRTESADYEMVNEDTPGEDDEEDEAADLDAPLDDADYELDELEAEIARELEDD